MQLRLSSLGTPVEMSERPMQQTAQSMEDKMALSVSEIAQHVKSYPLDKLERVTNFKAVYNGSAETVRYYSVNPIELTIEPDASGRFHGQASVQVVRDVPFNGKVLTGSDRFRADFIGQASDGTVTIERVGLSVPSARADK